MNKVYLQKLKDRAGEMALQNMWGENAYKINMEILRLDQKDSASCTRLAKYYMLKNNIAEAKNMYLKTLEIDPNNLGIIERDQKEKNMTE